MATVVKSVVFPADCNCCCPDITALCLEVAVRAGEMISFEISHRRGATTTPILSIVDAAGTGTYDLAASAATAGITLMPWDYIVFDTPVNTAAGDTLTMTTTYETSDTVVDTFHGDDIPLEIQLQCISWP